MLKIDVINESYSQLRISGLTVNPTPEDLELALNRYENMMTELGSRNICTGYNFELEPDPNSKTGVGREFAHMMATNLAVRLIPDFNVQAPISLMMQATQSLSNASGRSAADNVREVQYPRRMPRGSGNTLRFNRWQRFQLPDKLPPNSCKTNDLLAGQINDYQESFASYLDDLETIISFTIRYDDGLDLISSKNDDPIISFRVKARGDTVQNIWQQVRIKITTSTGRIESRFVNFEVGGNKTVGSGTTETFNANA